MKSQLEVQIKRNTMGMILEMYMRNDPDFRIIAENWGFPVSVMTDDDIAIAATTNMVALDWVLK